MNLTKSTKSFSTLLLVVATAFTLTACPYAVMMVHEAHPPRIEETSAAGLWLVDFMDRYGVTLLLVELGVLALATWVIIVGKGDHDES